MNQKEIPFNKLKLLLALVGSIMFVVLGVYLLFVWSEEPGVSNPLLKKILGVITVLFFGVVGILGIIKILRNKSALTINELGIVDNTNFTSSGLIKWENITGFKIEEMMSQKFLVIHISNAEEMIEAATGMRKKVMKSNYSMYRTPITIPASTVNYKLLDLKELLEQQLNESKL